MGVSTTTQMGGKLCVVLRWGHGNRLILRCARSCCHRQCGAAYHVPASKRLVLRVAGFSKLTEVTAKQAGFTDFDSAFRVGWVGWPHNQQISAPDPVKRNIDRQNFRIVQSFIAFNYEYFAPLGHVFNEFSGQKFEPGALPPDDLDSFHLGPLDKCVILHVVGSHVNSVLIASRRSDGFQRIGVGEGIEFIVKSADHVTNWLAGKAQQAKRLQAGPALDYTEFAVMADALEGAQ